MFGSGLLKGLGVTMKHFVDTFVDDFQKVPSRYANSQEIDGKRLVMRQPQNQEGLLTIQYPEEKRIVPERFRYIPMLLWDTDAGEDRCTACGICAKVCPPQCIWIVRDSDDAGKPVTRPAEFYIDASICMSCGFCAEFCPFDAIKMNHDYELAVYDRYPQLVYDKTELTVPIEYYAALWPTQYAAEETRRQQEAEEKRAKEEAKAAAAAAKAAAAETAAKPQAEKKERTPEELEEMKRRAKEKAAAAKARAAGGEVPAPAPAPAEAEAVSGDAEADAKKARMEELKRKAQEKAKQRKAEQ